GKQSLRDFIEWAHKRTGLAKSTVYHQLFPAHQATGQDTRQPTRSLARAFGRFRTGLSGTGRTLSTSTPTPVRWDFLRGRYSKSGCESSRLSKKRLLTGSPKVQSACIRHRIVNGRVRT